MYKLIALPFIAIAIMQIFCFSSISAKDINEKSKASATEDVTAKADKAPEEIKSFGNDDATMVYSQFPAKITNNAFNYYINALDAVGILSIHSMMLGDKDLLIANAYTEKRKLEKYIAKKKFWSYKDKFNYGYLEPIVFNWEGKKDNVKMYNRFYIYYNIFDRLTRGFKLEALVDAKSIDMIVDLVKYINVDFHSLDNSESPKYKETLLRLNVLDSRVKRYKEGYEDSIKHFASFTTVDYKYHLYVKTVKGNQYIYVYFSAYNEGTKLFRSIQPGDILGRLGSK